MSREKTWRERFRPLIAGILAETEGQPEKEIRRALRDAWPATLLGARACWPYKAWCAEIKAQRFPKAPKARHIAAPPGQGMLFREIA
jgi:hypothetical protein